MKFFYSLLAEKEGEITDVRTKISGSYEQYPKAEVILLEMCGSGLFDKDIL